MVCSGDQVRRYYMTGMEIWKVFGVYYITRLDLTNKYKTTLYFVSPKESFNGHWTTFSFSFSSSSSSFVCVCVCVFFFFFFFFFLCVEKRTLNNFILCLGLELCKSHLRKSKIGSAIFYETLWILSQTKY